MLEELALRYSDMPENQTRAIGYALVIGGAVAGGLTSRSAVEIRRAPYFALSCSVYLGSAVVIAFGLAFIVQALANGFFWLVLAIELFVFILVGFLFARLAIARSRDAYGHGRMAWLAFVPIANLVLLFRPSKNELSANRLPIIRLLTGGSGVFSGFVFLVIAGILSTYSEQRAVKRVEAATTAGVLNEVMLPRQLAAMAAATSTPIRVDEATVLVRLEADGVVLRYVYDVDPIVTTLPLDVRVQTMAQNCSYEGLAGVIDAGAVIEHTFIRSDGTLLGIVVVTRELCGR